MKLAQKFVFIHDGAEDYIYTAERDADGSYIVTWDWRDTDHPTVKQIDPFGTYDADAVERNIVNGLWRVQEVLIGPETPYEPRTQVVEGAWPFPPLEPSDEAVDAFAGFPPLEEVVYAEPVPDYGITLGDLRRSLKELQSGGWVLEVCEDFFVVRQEDDVYYDRFVASTEEDLTSILQAIRTLDKFVDRG